MLITRIDAIPFEIPLLRPTKWAAGYMDKVDWVLLKITAEDGTYGVAEAIPRPMIYGETQESVYFALTKYLAPLLLGEDSFALENIHRKMAALAQNPGARNAVDVALHDLNGKLLGLPVHRLLGGPAREAVDLVHMIGQQDEDAMLAELVSKVAEGFFAFKVKGGTHPDSDVRLLKRMRDHVPGHVRLYIDANMQYDKEVALRVLKALDGVLDCIEEPMLASDDQGRLALARSVSVPLLGDESVFTLADVRRQLELGALTRIGLKLPRSGFTLSRKMIHLAEAYNVKLQILTQSETTVGTAACLQLAAAFGQIALPNEMLFYLDVADSLCRTAPCVRDGRMQVPALPGNGTEIDWDKVERYRVAIQP